MAFFTGTLLIAVTLTFVIIGNTGSVIAPVMLGMVLSSSLPLPSPPQPSFEASCCQPAAFCHRRCRYRHHLTSATLTSPPHRHHS